MLERVERLEDYLALLMTSFAIICIQCVVWFCFVFVEAGNEVEWLQAMLIGQFPSSAAWQYMLS